MRGTGGRRSTWTPALVALVLAALVLPATAAAQKSETVILPNIKLEGREGMQLQVTGLERKVVATISKATRFSEPSGSGLSLGGFSNKYVSKGRATGHRIKANFGRFGKIDLTFTPSGKPKSILSEKGCEELEFLEQPGRFRGTLSFAGEEDFATFHARRIKGGLLELRAHDCPKKSRGPTASKSAGQLPKALLEASTPNESLQFLAAGYAHPGRPDFYALEHRKFGRIAEERTVLSLGDQGVFEFDGALESATIQPSGPFEGEASFRREASGVTVWSGTLTAPFLGGAVPLTGGRMEANLRRPRTGKKDARPDSGLPRVLANLTGSPVPIDR